MPTHPTHPTQPSTPPPQPPKQPEPQTAKPKAASPTAGVAPPEPGLALGAKPKDARDPQSAKFEAHAGPPHWHDPKTGEAKPREEWTPKPALDPLAEKPPEGAYADGMTSADEQRARAAWVEAHGQKAYNEAVDQRPPEERQNTQVPGVTPPTKRE